MLRAVATAADSPPRALDLFDLGAPSFMNFAPSSGVPEAVTVGVQTDSEGFVWIASPQGIARYDGRRWTPSPDPALAHSATSLWLDRAGHALDRVPRRNRDDQCRRRLRNLAHDRRRGRAAARRRCGGVSRQARRAQSGVH